MMDLVIIGGSTAFYEIFGIIREINLRHEKYRVVGILDDDQSLHGKTLLDVPVLGGISKASELKNNARFIFGIGSMRTRMIRHEILKKTGLEPAHFETIIHPNTSIDPTASIGPGCIIHHGVAIGNHVTLKGFNVVAVNSALGPYAYIDSLAMITSLCLVLSSSKIGKNSFIGAASCITENIVIEKGCFVGVGSMVTRSLAEGSYGIGNPFRVLKVEDVSNI
jgi:UDP-3-O-[3-hydroxymyristoyl] glucosamine N-acyltransferase